jgi:hypothetical protein
MQNKNRDNDENTDEQHSRAATTQEHTYNNTPMYFDHNNDSVDYILYLSAGCRRPLEQRSTSSTRCSIGSEPEAAPPRFSSLSPRASNAPANGDTRPAQREFLLVNQIQRIRIWKSIFECGESAIRARRRRYQRRTRKQRKLACMRVAQALRRAVRSCSSFAICADRLEKRQRKREE